MFDYKENWIIILKKVRNYRYMIKVLCLNQNSYCKHKLYMVSGLFYMNRHLLFQQVLHWSQQHRRTLFISSYIFQLLFVQRQSLQIFVFIYIIKENNENHLPYEQLFNIAQNTIQLLYDIIYRKIPKAIALLTRYNTVFTI